MKNNIGNSTLGAQGSIMLATVSGFSAREKMMELKSQGYLIKDGRATLKRNFVQRLKNRFVVWNTGTAQIPITSIGLSMNLGDQCEKELGSVKLKYIDVVPTDDWHSANWGILYQLEDAGENPYTSLATAFAIMERQSITGEGPLVRGINLFLIPSSNCDVLFSVYIVLSEELSLRSFPMSFLDNCTIRRVFCSITPVTTG